MSFQEDISLFFDAKSGAAVSAVFNSTAISVLFDDEHYAASGEGADISTSQPMVTCRAQDVAGIEQGDSITVDGTAYSVADVQPDGTGVMVLILQEA
ncbi:head-tail joining protein [Chlorobium sp.]|uniref:head-tail joining protein n=1 Tax=Chlorobium sp. TaxID=1095 RepID=UPI003C54221F